LTGDKSPYHYSVVRDIAGPGFADVALIRCSEPRGVLAHLLNHDRRDALVLHHRSFRPISELAELEAYAGQVERAAEHANNGTYGCFVETEQRDDTVVRVALYERWFDGEHLRCEPLAVQDFDSIEDDALVQSAAFLAGLRAWAEERNEEREAGYLDAAIAEAVRRERLIERIETGDQLARILSDLNRSA
jgi:hypothetical protein